MEKKELKQLMHRVAKGELSKKEADILTKGKKVDKKRPIKKTKAIKKHSVIKLREVK